MDARAERLHLRRWRGPPCSLETPRDEARQVCVRRRLDGSERRYEVSTLSAPPPDLGRAYGRDLDGYDSGGGAGSFEATCEELFADWASATDESSNGVDNSFATLAPTIDALNAEQCAGVDTRECTDGLIAGAIESDALSLTITLRGLDDWEHDPDVEVTLAIDGDEAAELRGSGRVLDGELVVPLGDASLPAWPSGILLPVELRDVELRAELDEDSIHGSLSGASPVDALVAQGFAAFGTFVTEPEVRLVIESVADIEPSEECPDLCRALSFGFRIEATASE